MKNWESIFLQRSLEIENGGDLSHDILHLKRVVSAAKKMGFERTLFMKSYLEQFEKEILPCNEILF